MVDGKPVCDDGWEKGGKAAGEVVCRQLGFSGLEEFTMGSRFGLVQDDFAMDNVKCSGDESRLEDCRYDTEEDCGGDEAAGVVCSRVVSLAGGANASEGNVLVDGRPVCDDLWDAAAGEVVCRQLGFASLVQITVRSRFGQVSASFAMDDVGCTGNETRLEDCGYSTTDDCTGWEGAGVVCSNTYLVISPGKVHKIVNLYH